MFQLALNDFKIFLSGRLREYDQRRANGDPARMQEVTFASDDEIIRRWLWIVTIIGGPACYLAVPFVISILQPFLWVPLAAALWIIAKCSMVIVFLLFLLAIYYTYATKQ